MKKIFAVLIVLSLMLGLAVPAMASQISATKDTIGEANTFYPGDTIYYIMTVSNPATNSATNTLTRIWDTLPDGTVIEFLASGETLVQEPGDFDTFYAEYVVDLDDAVWQDDPGRYRVTNRFQAVGIDSADDEIEASVNKNSTVLEFAELGDFVWNDMDKDGIQDDGEPGIADVTVRLWSADEDCNPNEIIGTTTTDEDGYYLFDELRAGNYRVQFELPNGDWVFTLQNVGADDALDSDADPDTGISDCVALAAGDSNMTIDAGMYELVEELEVSKTAVTSYVRTHLWDINKRVETENGITLEDGTPKIWLYQDGSGDETATWYVDVTYEGYEDSGFNVSGVITITNTGDLDAVITDISDMLGGNAIDVDCGDFAGALGVGDTLVCTYSENVESEIEGFNVITVTTEKDEYTANAEIVWGDPDDEADAVVTVVDDSDLFGEEELGTVTAPDDGTFTYDKAFAWTDYTTPGPYVYENTATIVETEQSASATLKVNWLYEELTVSKTAVTSYVRTHYWDIAKRVETEFGKTVDEGRTPKVWLYQDGSGDETATWYVDVTYLGYEDSEHNISGTVTIENTGTSDAMIIGVVDLLDGMSIDVDFGVTFPYALAAGDTLEGTYSEDGYIEGMNEVTVTTEVDEYTADAEIIWGDPDTENDDVVNIEDVSDLFGTVALGTLNADDHDAGDIVSFDYNKAFAWTDYTAPGPYVYDNTAVIVETEQSADARLKVNWEPPEEVCWADETAWAYGGEYANPNWDYVNNMFWGWTNGPLSEGSYEWDVYAGAGQNDLSKGTVVGTVYVTYEDGCVTVRYEMDEGYYLGETHLWVGNDVLPEVTRGRSTVYTNSPGQFPYGGDYGFDPDDSGTWETEWTWSACDFEGDIYVAAHAVVWMEVECPEDSSM